MDTLFDLRQFDSFFPTPALSFKSRLPMIPKKKPQKRLEIDSEVGLTFCR